jgi:diacylglycerol kinase family enzyme
MNGGGGDRPIPILVNPRAGRRGRPGERRLLELLEEAGVSGEVERVEGAGIGASVDRLCGEGRPAIAVSGGDGSIASAANRLAGTGTALLPVPTGTLNHFARRVGIDTVGRAVEALGAGRIETVPMGIMDDRVFLNTATFGLYADVVRRRERLRPFLSKWPAAGTAILLALMRLRPLEVIVEVEGESLRRSTALLWIGIGWGSFPRVLEAPEQRRSPDLELVVLRSRTRLGAVALMARLIRHLFDGDRPIRDPALEIIHARSLIIHAPHRIGVTLDGEVLRCDPPVFVAVQDRGLRVVCGGPG